jgi:hypothetical protein
MARSRLRQSFGRFHWRGELLPTPARDAQMAHFLRHVGRRPAGSYLFPNLRPDRFGERKITGLPRNGRVECQIIACSGAMVGLVGGVPDDEAGVGGHATTSGAGGR